MAAAISTKFQGGMAGWRDTSKEVDTTERTMRFYQEWSDRENRSHRSRPSHCLSFDLHVSQCYTFTRHVLSIQQRLFSVVRHRNISGLS